MMELLGKPLPLLVVVAVVLMSTAVRTCEGGVTSPFVRKVEKTIDMPLDADVFPIPRGYNAPQQVHITHGDHDGAGVIVSWVTPVERGSNTVFYGTSKNKLDQKAEGSVTSYKYYNYTSGYIHHCTLKHLKYDTNYFYKVGIGNTTRQFWFRTPLKGI